MSICHESMFIVQLKQFYNYNIIYIIELRLANWHHDAIIQCPSRIPEAVWPDSPGISLPLHATRLVYFLKLRNARTRNELNENCEKLTVL